MRENYDIDSHLLIAICWFRGCFVLGYDGGAYVLKLVDSFTWAVYEFYFEQS